MNDLLGRWETEWAGSAAAWPRWIAAFRRQTRAATELILELAEPKAGMHVLDLASGTGEPALEIATRVGERGRVVATDLVVDALRLCSDEAERRGLRQLHSMQAQLTALPFEAASFDAVTCRLGLMFCPDLTAALADIRRVLRPAARFTCVVWGDPQQPLFTSTLGEMRLLPTSPDQVGDRAGPFRFSRPGALSAALLRAGFSEIREESRVVPWPWPGDAAEMWTAFTELAGPSFGAELDRQARQDPRLHQRIVQRLTRYEHAGKVDPQAWLVAVRASA